MRVNLVTSLCRADELVTELESEYRRSLLAKEVSAKAVHLTHEICALIRGILDRLARAYWDDKIAPSITEEDRKKATVYFPICNDQQSFESTLGRWRWKTVRVLHETFYNDLLSLQPFALPTMSWLLTVNDLAVQLKHIDLVPQKRQEQKQTTVSSDYGSIAFSSSVTFGAGMNLMGAPINPHTQRIVPTLGVSDTVTVWVGFHIADYNVDALAFCKQACVSVREIATSLSEKHRL